MPLSASRRATRPRPAREAFGGYVVVVPPQHLQHVDFARRHRAERRVAAFALDRNPVAARRHQPGNAQAGAGTEQRDGRSRHGLTATHLPILVLGRACGNDSASAVKSFTSLQPLQRQRLPRLLDGEGPGVVGELDQIARDRRGHVDRGLGDGRIALRRPGSARAAARDPGTRRRRSVCSRSGRSLPCASSAKRALVPPMSATRRVNAARGSRCLEPSTARAAAATCSTVKPKCLNNSPAGADSPKRSMPTTSPSSPTYLRQKSVTPASTATRGMPRGSTASRSRRILAVEQRRATASTRPAPRSLRRRALLRAAMRERDFRAGRDDHHLRRAAAPRRAHSRRDERRHLLGRARLVREVLAREQQRRRTVAPFDRALPGHGGLDGIARPPDVHVRESAAASPRARSAGASGRPRPGRWNRASARRSRAPSSAPPGAARCAHSR